MVSMIHEGELDINALPCVDIERCHYISSFRTVIAVANIYRERWGHVDGILKLFVTETKVTQISETHYVASSIIDPIDRSHKKICSWKRNSSSVIGLFELTRHFFLSALLILGFYTSQAKMDVLQYLRLSSIQD